MIEYLRKFLIFIRKQNNNKDLNPSFITRLTIGALIGIITGVILDTILPFNFFTNMIRGIIANIVGFSTFSAIYIKSSELRRKKVRDNQYYNPIRKRFSYKQRINISIFIGAIIILLVVLSGSQGKLFTLKATVAIMSGLGLLAFSRPDRSEFIKGIYELPDRRDLEFISKKKTKSTKHNDNESDSSDVSEMEKEFNQASRERKEK